jgi:4'-phosphopantetheinyl transferase
MPGVRRLEVWFIDAKTAAPALEAIEKRSPRLVGEVDLRGRAVARTETDRIRRASHIALRLLLEHAVGPAIRGVDLTTGPMGKPGLPAAISGSFSLSHCAGHALIAISPQETIGADLERARDISVSDVRRRRILATAGKLQPERPLPQDPEEAFLQAWVRIEAVAKASGAGIGQFLTGHRIIGGQRRAPPSVPYQTVDLALDQGWFGALAGQQLDSAVEVRRLPTQESEIERLLR